MTTSHRTILAAACLVFGSACGGASMFVPGEDPAPDPNPVSAAPSASGATKPSVEARIATLEQPKSCPMPPGWRARAAHFDSPMTPELFAAVVNPLLVGQHPFSISKLTKVEGSFDARVSGTSTNAASQEFFPSAYFPSPAPLALSSTGIALLTPSDVGWLEILDVTSEVVWIPVRHITFTAAFDNGYCLKLTDGTLDAVIDSTAAPLTVTMFAGGGAITLGELLGPYTSGEPIGWRVRMSFSGDAAAIAPQ